MMEMRCETRRVSPLHNVPPHRMHLERIANSSAQISDAALVLLTELGYERMTIDMVPVRAKTARATVFRRWATKADLVTWIIDVANAG